MRAKFKNGTMTIAREHLDAGGYTARGAYFGVGQPLFRVDVEFDDSGEMIHGHVRAPGARVLSYALAPLSLVSEFEHAFSHGIIFRK
jgi:hypothetical protein